MAAKRPSIRFALLASLLAGGLLACQLIVGVEDDVGAVRPPDAGFSDAAADRDSGEPTCALRKPPGPPAASTVGAIDNIETVFYALERVAIDPTDAGGVIGYDLDNRCTGLPTEPIADAAVNRAPCVTPMRVEPFADGDGGVDNAFRDLFGAFAFATHPSPDRAANFFNDDIEVGARTLIVAIKDYNGAADDTEVNVALVASEGLTAAVDGGPRWDGTDVWTHTEGWLNGPTFTLRGYVRDHVLVASPIKDELRLSFGGFSVMLHTATIIAKIAPMANRLEDGTIIGRAIANEFIAAAGQIPVKDKYCGLSENPGVLGVICAQRDLGSNADPSATCDSISVGIGFSAVAARVEVPAQKDPALVACDAAPTCSP